MTDRGNKTFVILPASSGSVYEGLRALWSSTFGDPPEYVDAFYENFDGDITGHAVVDEAGKVCSALTCHLCGEYEGRPVYVSYAICTREDMRGLGLAAELTAAVRDEVTEAGGISIVSPAEPSLVGYYSALGYEPHFFATERAVMSPDFDLEEYDDFDEFDLDMSESGLFGGPEGDSAGGRTEGGGPLRPEIDLQPVSRERYGMYREAFLAGRPHIRPSDSMLRYVEAESLGGHGMYSVNRGDAICVISSADPGRVVLTELILNPVLHELSMDIDAEIAAMIAKRFGAAETVYRTPGAGACQSLVYGLPPREADPDEDPYGYAHAEEGFEILTEEPYYGFPID